MTIQRGRIWWDGEYSSYRASGGVVGLKCAAYVILRDGIRAEVFNRWIHHVGLADWYHKGMKRLLEDIESHE